MPSVSNPLQQAVFRGCVECIRMLVETPPFYSVDASCGPDGLRPIHIAAREGHIQTLRYLAAAGACLQRSDVNGATALHHAATSGQLRAVRWLLRHGAKILLDKRGRSPIQVAADHDHMEIVSVLAKHATCGTTQATTTSGANTSLTIRDEGNLTSLPTTTTTTSGSSSNHNSNINGNSNHHILSGSSTISVNHNSNQSDSISTISPTNSSRTITSSSNNNSNSCNDPDTAVSKNYSNNHNHSLSLIDNSSEDTLHENNKGSITGGGDCASSSGNSSLTTTSASTPSLSPSSSSSSAVSCGCSGTSENSDDVTLKSAVEVSDSFTLEEYSSSKASGRSSVTSPSPFYLHPPKSSLSNSTNSSPSNNNSVVANSSVLPVVESPPPQPQQPVTTPTGKKSNHKRQVSTCSPAASSPFFLHPPENLVTETQKAVAGKMAPAPVNPSHGHHHVTELINESHNPKMKGGEISSTASSASSSGSPPPTPPIQKSSLTPSSSPVNGNGKFPNGDMNNNMNGVNNKNSEINSVTDTENNDIQINNIINTKNVPPPPPPPPMPNFAEMNLNGHNTLSPSSNGHLHGIIGELERMNGRTHSPKTPDTDILLDDTLEGEHDYEVIDELTNHVTSNNHTNHYEFNKKLARSVSAPPPPLEHNMNGHGLLDEKPGTPTVPSHISKNLGMGGKPGVPFIPPHFPSPAHDALIKPSEYLRSIQQTQGGKSKYANGNGTTNNASNTNANSNGGIARPLSRVEEAIKALGATDNHLGLMSPVPEETNVEDEFEEINPERINGDSHANKINGNENATRENNNNSNHNSRNNNTMHYSNGQCKGGGIIKAEELMKVNLRKTPMSRTKSAPPLGRVVPDGEHNGMKNGLANIPENGSSHNASQQNGHEILRKSTNVLNNNNQNAEVGTISRAAIIAELAESSQVGGVREWKEELRRRQVEQEKNAQKEIAQYYQPVNFVAEVPSTDVSGTPIPAWKRQMMAKKAAERARKEAEEQRKMELEAKRMASIPMWRRQLLQRRESDGKYAQ